MFTQGHKQILDEALEKLGREYTLDNDSYSAIIEGLAFPDFPCPNLVINGDRVDMNFKNCNTFQMLYRFWYDDYSIGNQSHNGLYAAWHSMTFDPLKTVENIAKNIAEYVLICCKNALELSTNERFVWLGFALHIIQDSYSPSHTLRESRFSKNERKFSKKEKDSEDSADSKDSTTDPKVTELTRMIKDIVADMSRGTSRRTPIRKIVDKYPEDLKRNALFIAYDHVQREMLVDLNIRCLPSDFRSSRKNKRIQNFYYYNNQAPLSHSAYDFIEVIKRKKLYSACVDDTCEIIRLVVSNFSKPCSKRDLSRVLREIYKFISSKTLAVSPRFAKAHTG